MRAQMVYASNTRRAIHQAASPPAMNPNTIPHAPSTLSPAAPTSVATIRLMRA